MKKLFILLILVLMMPMKVNANSAKAAIVMDADSGRVLYSKNANTKMLIASTTKIMTAIVAIENADINDIVKINNDILKAYGSAIYVEVGEELTLKELIFGLMLRSGNDAAIAIASYVGGSMENFVSLMNQYAYNLGMDNTTFINSHGLEDKDGNGNMSTAYDMALLMKYAMNNDVFREITSTKKITVKSTYKTYVWINKNKLLSNYEYTTGGKTGFTEKANRTLVTSATKDDKNLIVVTLDDPSDFSDHETFYEDYFDAYDLKTILDKDEYLTSEYYDNEQLFIKNDFKILLQSNEEEKVSVDIKISDIDKYNNYDCVGYIEVMFNGEKIHDEPIFILKDEVKKEKESFFKKLLDFLKFWD